MNTAERPHVYKSFMLWFAFKLVSLSHWIQPVGNNSGVKWVVICFQISIFEPLNTATGLELNARSMLWFAFKLVSLSHWIQPVCLRCSPFAVVICFQISIFEPLNTAIRINLKERIQLWFAFKLVSLSHWIQQTVNSWRGYRVVICFQISIFEPLNTAISFPFINSNLLWFAFKLVSLSHWIQLEQIKEPCTLRCDLLSN